METQILIYLLKASMAFAVFYLLYLFCFRNDTLLNIRRFYFLFIILFSLAFPFVNIELSSEQYNALPEFLLSAVTITANDPASEVSVADTAITAISFQQIVMIFLISGSFILFTRFIIQLISLLRLRNSLKQECKGIFRYVYLEKESLSSSFSFFNWIFLNSSDSKIEKSEIIAHEEEHARQLHSIDVLLIEATCILFWWNPFVWILRNELKTNLEYLADRGVVNKGYSSYEYQYTLLQSVNNNTGIPLINNFNVSQLKKRITMMNKEKTSVLKSVKYLLSLPIIAGLLSVNCSLNGALQDNSDLKFQEEIELKTVDEIKIDEKTIKVNAKTKDYTKTNSVIKNEIETVNISEISENPKDPELQSQKDHRPYTTVEQMPRYPGGDNAMFSFISKNLKYPLTAKTGGIQGRVIVRFIVDKTGEIKEPKIIRGIDPECDQEALRVVSEMPKWNPGKQNGKEVSVYYTLPIIFKLMSTETKDESPKES